jgi:putative spermidine/putrescine transport system permease protein
LASVVASTVDSTPVRRIALPASKKSELILLFLPCLGFIGFIFVVPIAYVLALSVTEPTFTLEHYARIFNVRLYLHILWNTFYTSVVVTVVCLLLAYPLAYVMACRKGWFASILLGIVAMSFWTGFVVRTYAWLIILGSQGPVAAAYTAFGFGTPPQMLYTSFSSTLGMIHIMLPYMVLALYSVMSRIDTDYSRAAHSLGAPPSKAFIEVFLPLSFPGIVNGSILVFTIVLGFYVTPILLGTPQDMMISQLINEQIEQLLNWGFASALAVVLLLSTLTILLIYNRLVGLDRLWG